MNVKFILKRTDGTTSSLMTQFWRNNKKINLYPGVNVDVSNWSDTQQAVLPCTKNRPNGDMDADIKNEKLDTFRTELRRILLIMDRDGVYVTKDRIKKELDLSIKKETPVEAKQKIDFIQFIERHSERKKGDVSDKTICRYEYIRALLIEFKSLCTNKELERFNSLKKNDRRKYPIQVKEKARLEFDELDDDLIWDFRKWLQKKTYWKKQKDGSKQLTPYSLNYVNKKTKDLLGLIKAATAKKLVSSFETTVKIKTEDSDSVAPNWSEIKALMDVELHGDEDLARSIFCFNCYLGLRISDLKRISKASFVRSIIDGEEAWKYIGRAIKTDDKSAFYIEPEALEILKYLDFKFPALNDKDYNNLIKVVAQKAGLDRVEVKRITRGENKRHEILLPMYERLSSHSARRAFARNFYEDGADLDDIAYVTSHKSHEDLLTYIGQTKRRPEDQFRKMRALRAGRLAKMELEVA